MKKYNKKVISYYSKVLDGENFEVYVLDDKKYFNIHVISDKYKGDELNTLKLQEPKEDLLKEVKNLDGWDKYFTKSKLIGYLLEHFIWDRFYSEGIFTGYVVSEFETI